MQKSFPCGSDGKESACNEGDPGSVSGLGKWQPTPVFLPGEIHEQRRLEGYSPWDCRVRHDYMANTLYKSVTVYDLT